MNQFRFFQVLGTALTLAIIGACSSSDSDESESKSVPSLTLTITDAPSINIANESSYGVSGTCIGGQGDQNSVVKVVLGSKTLGSPACADGGWEVSAHDVSGIGDSKSLKLTVTQGEEEVSQTLIKDTTASDPAFDPNLNITGANFTNYIIRGTCPEDGTVSLTIRSQDPVSISCAGRVWTHASIDTTSWTDGTNYNLSATLTDTVGNTGASVSKSVSKDTTSLAVDINPPTPINNANKGNYPVSGGCSSPTGTLTVTVGGEPPGTQPSCSNSRTWETTVDVSSVTDGGAVEISVGLAGGGDTASASTTVLKDIVSPTLTITPPSAINSINQSSYSVSGTCPGAADQSIQVVIGGLNFKTNCASNNWTLESKNISTLTESSITITADTTDAAGNAATQASASVVRDVIAPVLTITTSNLNINAVNVGTYTLAGSCEGTTNVIITIGNLDAVTVSCPSTSWTLPSKDMSALVDKQNIDVLIAQDDVAGNHGTFSGTLNKDVIAPAVIINTLTGLTDANKAVFPLTGSCNENNSDVVVSANTTITPTPQPTCQSSGWTTNIDLSTLRGDITIRAYQIDAAGNRGDAPVKIILSKRKTFLHSKISSGRHHFCALSSEGGVKCWGRQLYGPLGNNSVASANILYPVDVVGPDTDSNISGGDGVLGNIVQISAGDSHTCALNSSGNVLCWGQGTSGKLGNNATENSSFPVQVVGPDADSDNNGDGVLGNIVQISAGGSHTCALNSSGNVLCWGKNYRGQLGDDSTNDRGYPAFVVDRDGSSTPLRGVVQLSAGDSHTCALTSAETVLCWGNGWSGQLGSSSEIFSYVNSNEEQVSDGVNRDAPLAVLTQQGGSSLSGIAQVASGFLNTCVLTLDGHVKCWGGSYQGALGDNGVVTEKQSWFPVDVVGEDTDGSSSGSGLLSDIVQIILGSQYACALNAQGKVSCWGHGGYGKLGNGSTDNKNYPVSVIAGSGSSSSLSGIVEIDSLYDSACALSEEGRVLCWGQGAHGKLGYGGTGHQSSPVTVIPASGSTDFLNIGTYRGSYTCKGGACAFDPIGLSLAGSSSSPSTGTSPSIGVSGIATGKTLNLYSSADCSDSSKGTASPSDTTIALSGLSEGAYKYYFDITDASSNRFPCSKSFISYIYDNTAPSRPTLSFDPASGGDTTPDISVSGITPGDLVRVYSNSGCTTVAAPATRVDGVSRSITLNAISGAAAYNFYATATDAAGNVSACSSSATYTLEGL